MNFFTYLSSAIRTLFAKGRRNVLKILTLALGLAVGLVLASKVCFEQTYDDFYSGADRIYYLSEVVTQNGELLIYPQTSGAVAPSMKVHYPQVEEASRFTFFESGASLIDVETQTRYSAGLVQLADSCFFKVLDRECLAGDLTTSLGLPLNAVISSKMAMTMASSKNKHAAAREMIGRQFTIGSRGSGNVFTVTGVFEEFPVNSTNRPDVLVSLPSIGLFMYDGTQDYNGNDRYISLVKLEKGVSGEDFNAQMDSFVYEYLPVEEIKAMNAWFTYSAKPYMKKHTESQDVHNTILVLGFVAFALLLVAVLNYLLIVVSTSVTRSKEMALRKCLGSEVGDTAKMMMSESLLHTLAATALAAIMLLAARGFVENFLGIGLADLFTGKPLALAIGIIVVVVALTGLVPTAIFNRIPVATAFRGYSENRRTWKLLLLIVEFTLVAFLCVLIGVISLQYSKMANADLGYDYENLVELATPESSPSQHLVLMEELRAMPEVEDACFSFMSFSSGFSGNNVRLPDRDEDLFGIQDMYWVDDHWLDVIGIKIKEGRNFNPDLGRDMEAIVDTRFVEKFKAMTGEDDVLGRQIIITEHGSNVTIVGIIDPISMGHFSKTEDEFYSRPMVLFFCNPNDDMGRYHYPFQFIRFHKMSSEALSLVNQVTDKVIPGQATYVNAFKTSLIQQYQDTLETRNSILAGCLITLLIAILGLIGYTVDEIKRRSKEIAVRRVNGAQFNQITDLFLRDTMRIAIPSAIAGCIVGVIVALRWEQNFTLRVGMPWWIVLGAAIFTIAAVALVTYLFVNKTANTNPVESIKTE